MHEPTLRIVRTCSLLLLLAVVIAGAGCKDGTQGRWEIDVSGGDAFGPDGRGGEAGSLWLEVAHGSDSDIDVRDSGKLDVGFDSIEPVVDTGPNPLDVTDDLVVLLDPMGPPAAGVAYALGTEERIYISDGDEPLGEEGEIATGIHVHAGATLELPLLNFGTTGTYELSHGILNDGVITAPDFDAFTRGSLDFELGGDYAGSGDVVLFGELDGQGGGDFELEVEGVIATSGDILTHGADSSGGAGGPAGYITLTAAGSDPGGLIEITGDLIAHGGAGAGSGGPSGQIEITARALLVASGEIDARGGAGGASGGDGGEGGDVTLLVVESGDLLRSGDLRVTGGASVAADGGEGGAITLDVTGGELRVRGDLLAGGGDTELVDGMGGSGGQIVMMTHALIPGGILIGEAGDVRAAGDLDVSGGRGGHQGGHGGMIFVRVDNSSAGTDQAIRLYDYRRIRGGGGSGEFLGGSGLTMTILSGKYPRPAPATASAVVAVPPLAGITRIEPFIDGTGGDADPAIVPSVGGEGGEITSNDPDTELVGYDLSGGDGDLPGADGSFVVASPAD